MARRQYHSVTRERAAVQTRSLILRSAAAVFASNGYPRTTINEIAAHAEVGVNTVYTVFGTKANLLAALINEALDNPVIADGAWALKNAKTGPAVIRGLAQMGLENSSQYTIFDIGSKNQCADPVIAAAMDAALTRIRGGLAAAVQRLDALGVLSPDLSLDKATDVLYFYLGPPAWSSLFDIDWSFDRAGEFLAEQACRALLRRGRSSTGQRSSPAQSAQATTKPRA